MKEKIADTLVDGLAKTFDVGFDIGKVSAGVAQGYFDLKRFQLILGYAYWASMILLFLGLLTYVAMSYLKALKRGCLAEREEKLQQIADEREVFASNISNEVRQAAKKEVDEMNREVRRQQAIAFKEVKRQQISAFGEMMDQNREAWKSMMKEKSEPSDRGEDTSK